MAAIGFGQKVTGGGYLPESIHVTSGANSGTGSLASAIEFARKFGGEPTSIYIQDNLVIQPRAEPHTIGIRNLTITGGPGSKIMSNELDFDCSESDNVILQNLFFEGTPASDQLPRDTIKFDASAGRGDKGFWIDHCHFESYFDLNITANAGDVRGNPPPLLMTVSNCYFHNNNPDSHKNNGALGIHGFHNPNNTNAYATVVGNVFETVRRRSPRSSGKCVVHAFNNVLIRWGSVNGTGDQINGMESGNDGRLVVQANYFQAGALKQTIDLATRDPNRLGELTIDDADETLKNVYVDGAVPAGPKGTQIAIGQVYRDQGLTSPEVRAMNDALKAAIQSEAGLPRS